jgi:LmbE family N-acetylglucosaminyl deacetylase
MSSFNVAAIRRALIVAPHPDDESLGCGGLLAILANQRADVTVVFVTDGGASHLHSRAWPRERLAAQRRAEAHAALFELGLSGAERIFLNLRDADMPLPGSEEWRNTVAVMSGVLEKRSPELVVVPWRRDPHCDHRASWLITRDAIGASLPIVVLEYAIWLEEFGVPSDCPQPDEVDAIAIDITKTVAAKKRAVAAHHSQTTALIDDDPNGFRLSSETIERLTTPVELYWRMQNAAD